MAWISIKNELSASRENGGTSIVLVAWIVSIMDRALNEVYGSNYSDLCAQSSMCVKHLLDRIGIRSRTYSGDVCFKMTYKGDTTIRRWEGFWGTEHHVWVMSEFREIIDLTISHLHLHQNSFRNDTLPIPVIWWQLKAMPKSFLYIPSNPVDIELLPEERENYEKLIHRVDHYFDAEVQSDRMSDEAIPPILMDKATAVFLYQQGNPWIIESLDKFEKESCELPPYMAERDKELRRMHKDS